MHFALTFVILLGILACTQKTDVQANDKRSSTPSAGAPNVHSGSTSSATSATTSTTPSAAQSNDGPGSPTVKAGDDASASSPNEQQGWNSSQDTEAPSNTDDTGSDMVEAGDGESASTAACLLGDCDASATTTLGLTVNALEYFPAGQSNCQLGNHAVVKALHANRLVILWRAYYAAVGRWQLFGRKITVSADGTMSFDGDKVNLLPTCDGNTSGVTAFSVSEYADGTSSTHGALDLRAADNIAAFKLSITCVNSAQSATRVLDVTTLGDSVATTRPFLSGLGALGYWPEKSVYIKANGESLNPDGTAGTVVIPQTGITKVFGSDAGGLYVWTTTGRYVRNTLAVEASNIDNFRSNFRYGDELVGSYVFNISPYGDYDGRLSRWSQNQQIAVSNSIYMRDSNYIDLLTYSKQNKTLVWGNCNSSSYDNYDTQYFCGDIGRFDLANGTIKEKLTGNAAFASSYLYNSDAGFFGPRLIFVTNITGSGSYSGKIHLTSAYFQ